MASFVLGAAGAAVGSLFGNPALGWMIGVSLGSALGAPTLRDEGPRLTDLKIQTSTWGKMIPVVYGAMRIAGNLIWSGGIIERRQVDSRGGKGGPTVESTTYTYSASFAVSLCEGPIFGIRKIWANGTLIYNNDPGVDVPTLLNNHANQIRVYAGNETQLPDPTIEADKGVGNVPAYRGQAFVVFRDLPLEKFGNRIPNLEFEVLQAGEVLGFRQLVNKTNPALTSTLSLTKLMLTVEEGVIRVTRPEPVAPVEVFGEDGCFLGLESRRHDEARVLLNHAATLIGRPMATFIEIQIDASRLPPWGDPAFPALLLLKNGVPWWSDSIPGNETLAGAVLSADGQVLMITTFVVADGKPGAMRWYQFATDDRLRASGPAQADRMHQPWFNWRRRSSGGLYVRFRAAALESDYTHLWCHQYDDLHSFLYAIDETGLLARRDNFNSSAWAEDPAIWADEGVCVLVDYIGVKIFTRLNAVAPTHAKLADIVRDQCRRSGLSEAQLDLAELTDAVHGYAIARPASARRSLAPLQRAFFFDAAESEGKLKCRKRGSAPVATLAWDDLAAYRSGEEPGEPLSSTRAQETDLPAAVTVTFPNVQADYLPGSETSRRLITQSKQVSSDELGIAMTADQAAQVSAVLLYDAHVARSTCSFRTSRKYAHLEPADVVLVQTPQATLRLRITKKTDEDSLITFEAVADDASVYTATSTGGSQMVPQWSTSAPGPTRVQLLDIPILRDEDDDAGFYIVLGGYKETWRGATLFRAVDNLAFEGVGSVTQGAVFGLALTRLGPWSGGNFLDEASTVEVVVIQGGLSSIAFDALLNGGNAALIGNEIVQFRTAILIGPGRYRLGGLLRGRQGTERHANAHGLNESFVLLGVTGTLRVNEGTVGINAPRYYKAASFGSSVARAGSYAFTNTASGLKPWQPVHWTAARQPNGDWLLRWIRRTRIDGRWRDTVDAGLGEATETYELEILFGSTVRRLITSHTPAITYSAAQQIADFGALQTGLIVRLYQLSATVGRSDALAATFT